MSFLSGLLNPKKAIKRDMRLLDPTDVKGKDPLRVAYNDSKTPNQAAAQDPGMAGADPMADYYGDPSDPMYGDFAKPFDVEAFYDYADPGYAFQLQQGNQALLNSAAAGSGALSGAALKDLLKYNQDYAGTAYDNAFNRYQVQQGNIFQRLMGVAQLGQGAAAGVGTQGTALAGNAGQAISNAGAAYGAGIVGAGNSLGQGATNYWLYKNPQLWSGGGTGAV